MPSILKKFSLEEETKDSPDFLKQKYVTSYPLLETVSPPTSHSKKKVRHTHSTTTQLQTTYLKKKNYLLQLPTLGLAVVSFFGCYLMLKNVQPAAIKDTLLPNSYLPLLLLFGTAIFFLSWYLVQHIQRSFFMSIACVLLLALRIHHMWSPVWLTMAVLPLLLVELLLTYKSFRR